MKFSSGSLVSPHFDRKRIPGEEATPLAGVKNYIQVGCGLNQDPAINCPKLEQIESALCETEDTPLVKRWVLTLQRLSKVKLDEHIPVERLWDRVFCIRGPDSSWLIKEEIKGLTWENAW